jgi:hypothetical protein
MRQMIPCTAKGKEKATRGEAEGKEEPRRSHGSQHDL